MTTSVVFVSLRIKTYFRRRKTGRLPEIILLFGLLVEISCVICDTLTYHLGGLSVENLADIPVTLPLNKVCAILLYQYLKDIWLKSLDIAFLRKRRVIFSWDIFSKIMPLGFLLSFDTNNIDSITTRFEMRYCICCDLIYNHLSSAICILQTPIFQLVWISYLSYT